MLELDLLEKKEIRDENIDKIEVLEQVKKLLTLPKSELTTVKGLCEYYSDVPGETVKSCYKYNKEEIDNDGVKKYTKDNLLKLNFNLKTKRGGFNILDENGNPLTFASGSNDGILLFTKRAVLRIGMLLTGSKVAEEVRTRILDIVHDSEDGNGSINTIISELDEEKKLMYERVEAEYAGDFQKVSLINAKLFELKNKRIDILEGTLSGVSGILNNNSAYDVGAFAKSLNIKGMGRNNLFKFLRNENILMENNEPYQNHIQHFEVKYTEKNGKTYTKTLITPLGIKYVIEQLYKGGYIQKFSKEKIQQITESLTDKNR